MPTRLIDLSVWVALINGALLCHIGVMKNRFSSLFAGVVAVLLTLPNTVFGLAGSLEHPSLSFPEAFESEVTKKIMKLLALEENRYSDGFFVNASTSLNYAGDVAALNHFLKELAAVPKLKLSVSFEPEVVEGTWRLSHTAWGDAWRFSVSVNLENLGVEKSQVVIPAKKETEPASGDEPAPTGGEAPRAPLKAQ